MLRTFIQVSAVLLTLFASILLVRGAFVLSSTDIASLSSTHWDYNEAVIKNLSQQQTDTRAGVVLLLLSVVLQVTNLVWPMRYCDFAVSKKGVISAVIVSICIFIAALIVSTLISIQVQKEVSNIAQGVLQQDK